MGRGWAGWGEVEGTGGRLTYIKEHFSLYISFYLKYPHSSDSFLRAIFKENILRFLPAQINYTDSSEKMENSF
jgi:hypothetical protein